MKRSVWVVKKAIISGQVGQGPMLQNRNLNQVWRKHHARMADRHLASLANAAIRADPTLDKDSMMAIFTGHVKHPDQMQGDQLSRVRSQAYKQAYGTPNANMALLPALVAAMASEGHSCEYTTFDGIGMVAVVLAVTKSESDRL